MATIYWAGDSTVQYNDINTYPQTGIGQVFHLFVKPEVRIENHAKNGRSTKSFIDESRVPAIYDRITEGDFLFIQFGHNDEKIADPTRYTEPFSDYMINLEKFVNVARNKKAWPVLITPLERRCFTDEHHLGSGEHGDYVAAMKMTAEKLNVPLVDLYSMSREMMEKAGAERTKEWFMHLEEGRYPSHPEGLTDNTHLKYAGAVAFGGCIARGLKELGGIYKELLLEEQA
ncbi:MAG: rhamnogalacturonan acetylesterase [Lachnospiraceae bacterium]|nr:rhamnogalacturonan acetylesterase [Lachnospiraceae bacterium]